jgi:hypothetical protein
MNRFNRVAAWGRLLLAGWAVLGAAGACAGQADDFEQAMQAYERNHWAAAYAGLSALADQGHAPSARLALLMVRFGPQLYASRFEAAAPRRQQWVQAAATDSSLSVLAAAGPQAAR